MKRLIILLVLVAIAAIAGVVARSHSRSEVREIVSHSTSDSRQVIRESYELAPGAMVELAGLNGSVNIETSNSKTAQILIERTAGSQEALDRRQIKIEATANSLRIRGEKHSGGFFSRFFGSDASEKVSLKLPRQVSLMTKGVNGAVTVGEIEGSVEVAGVNGKVEIANAAEAASFKGVNGNIFVALKRLGHEGITLSGVNGNIELRLPADANADLEAKGMNGRVISELPNVTVDKSERGNYTARIGNGGNAITAKGINGNIRLTRATSEAAAAEADAASTSKE
ncbi:MAG TPA: DUF4097 family beta strand repeat-containing protein [Pyrinomonadaceae bacterium]|nr:DUF4097 family beta strand repeat-containing protein [Pyrinomonadaceae bacterium]